MLINKETLPPAQKMISKETGKQLELRCQRCLHKWEYRGQNPYFTLCPHCRTTVRIRKKEGQEVVQPVQVEAHVQADTTAQAGILRNGQQPT
jgi:Zn finger protein HypA/HybF involved in hydrogenase expression